MLAFFGGATNNAYASLPAGAQQNYLVAKAGQLAAEGSALACARRTAARRASNADALPLPTPMPTAAPVRPSSRPATVPAKAGTKVLYL